MCYGAKQYCLKTNSVVNISAISSHSVWGENWLLRKWRWMGKRVDDQLLTSTLWEAPTCFRWRYVMVFDACRTSVCLQHVFVSVEEKIKTDGLKKTRLEWHEENRKTAWRKQKHGLKKKRLTLRRKEEKKKWSEEEKKKLTAHLNLIFYSNCWPNCQNIKCYVKYLFL